MSGTDVLLNVATAARLFHASDGTGFADLIIDGHRETWPLRSKLRRVFALRQASRVIKVTDDRQEPDTSSSL